MNPLDTDNLHFSFLYVRFNYPNCKEESVDFKLGLMIAVLFILLSMIAILIFS